MSDALDAARGVLARLRGAESADACTCTIQSRDRTLAVDARDCEGRPGTTAACRATVARAAASASVDRLRVRDGGAHRHYDPDVVALLRAAGRFAELARDHAPVLSERALREPLAAARAAAARAGPVDEVAAETGLLDAARDVDEPFEPAVAPTVAGARVDASPPPGARLRTSRELSTGATVRIYDRPDRGTARYHLEPVEAGLDDSALETLADAAELLATDEDAATPARALRRAADDGVDVRRLARVLRKHTRGYGVLEDCFADPAVSDVYASGPAAETPLRVVADGEPLRSNITLSADGAGALASKLRRASGRSLSRASPTLDATVRIAGERVRVAALLEPATEGHAFALRAGGDDAFTLPALVASGTLTPAVAGLLSVAVRRSAACLVAGSRGAGKTTLLGALLWELPTTRRVVVVEDTPELPVGSLQDHGRDVQPVRTSLRDGPGVGPAEALRTALRLGEGALAVGEVRGEEAATLFEAMRVGAGGEAVLGTIHGDGAADVRERVVGDVGVPASSFAATDLVVTCEHVAGADGAGRRVAAVEEVGGPEGERVATLCARDGHGLALADRLDRGESAVLEDLARPGETYAEVREHVRRRASLIGDLAERGTTDPGGVTTAYARYGGSSC